MFMCNVIAWKSSPRVTKCVSHPDACPMSEGEADLSAKLTKLFLRGDDGGHHHTNNPEIRKVEIPAVCTCQICHRNSFSADRFRSADFRAVGVFGWLMFCGGDTEGDKSIRGRMELGGIKLMRWCRWCGVSFVMQENRISARPLLEYLTWSLLFMGETKTFC